MSRVRTDAKLVLSIQSHITLLSPQKYFNKLSKLGKYSVQQGKLLFYFIFYLSHLILNRESLRAKKEIKNKKHRNYFQLDL